MTDWLQSGLTIFVILALTFIVWSRITGQGVGEILSELKEFMFGK